MVPLLAGLIDAIGRDEFPGRMLSVYREAGGCDFCSGFLWTPNRGPRLLFAAGEHPAIPGFALAASRQYERDYWRGDGLLRPRCFETAQDGAGWLMLTPERISDPRYREACYLRPGIAERLTVFETVAPGLSISGYRMAARGPATPAERRRLFALGPVLLAAARRHEQGVGAPAAPPSVLRLDAMRRQARDWGLSVRETEVAVGLADGVRQEDIAARCGLALATVVTYRRRAYEKLGVANRRELKMRFESAGRGDQPSGDIASRNRARASDSSDRRQNKRMLNDTSRSETLRRTMLSER